MSARAVTKIKADWSKLTALHRQSELLKINKLKSQVDSTAIKVSSLPETLPKIDWAHYKKHASDPKLVEEIEKKYTSIKVNSPNAPASRYDDLKRAKEQDKARFEQFAIHAKSTIDSAEVVKAKFKNMIPVQEMTQEEWALTFPEWSSSIENPSVGSHWGRTPGLTREEAIAFEQPDPVPYSTKTAWKDWEERKKKFYSD